MIIDCEQEVISLRKSKLKILLNKTTRQRLFCHPQHQIIRKVLEPPQRIFSYSRSIRHFQEIMSKTGSISLNKKAITLFLKREESIIRKQPEDIQKTNSKQIQTDDLIWDEYGTRTERHNKLESPYVKSRKFSQHLNIKEKFQKQAYISQASDLQPLSQNSQQLQATPKTGRSIKQYTFQNEVLQQKVQTLKPLKTTNLFNKKRGNQQENYKHDTIFTTITQRY